MSELEERVDGLEEIIAQLTMAYSEVWMIVQSLLSVVLVDKTEEEQKAYWSNLEQVRIEMFKEMKKASDKDVAGTSSDFIRAVENLVTGESPTDEPEQSGTAGDTRSGEDT